MKNKYDPKNAPKPDDPVMVEPCKCCKKEACKFYVNVGCVYGCTRPDRIMGRFCDCNCKEGCCKSE